MSHGNQKRLLGLNHISHHTPRDTVQRGVLERAHGAQAVFTHDFLGRAEDRWARQRPVDNAGSADPRLHVTRDHLGAAGFAVRWSRPDNRCAVATGHDEQAFSDRRHAVVAGAQLLPFHAISQAAQPGHPCAERRAALIRVGPALGGKPFRQLLGHPTAQHLMP